MLITSISVVPALQLEGTKPVFCHRFMFCELCLGWWAHPKRPKGTNQLCFPSPRNKAAHGELCIPPASPRGQFLGSRGPCLVLHAGSDEARRSVQLSPSSTGVGSVAAGLWGSVSLHQMQNGGRWDFLLPAPRRRVEVAVSLSP